MIYVSTLFCCFGAVQAKNAGTAPDKAVSAGYIILKTLRQTYPHLPSS